MLRGVSSGTEDKGGRAVPDEVLRRASCQCSRSERRTKGLPRVTGLGNRLGDGLSIGDRGGNRNRLGVVGESSRTYPWIGGSGVDCIKVHWSLLGG